MLLYVTMVATSNAVEVAYSITVVSTQLINSLPGLQLHVHKVGVVWGAIVVLLSHYQNSPLPRFIP